MVKIVKSDFKYFGPARLFGGRFPPNGGAGYRYSHFFVVKKPQKKCSNIPLYP